MKKAPIVVQRVNFDEETGEAQVREELLSPSQRDQIKKRLRPQLCNEDLLGNLSSLDLDAVDINNLHHVRVTRDACLNLKPKPPKPLSSWQQS